jgi:hypothetical protein
MRRLQNPKLKSYRDAITSYHKPTFIDALGQIIDEPFRHLLGTIGSSPLSTLFNFQERLNEAFTWSESPQGQEFWYDVNSVAGSYRGRASSVRAFRKLLERSPSNNADMIKLIDYYYQIQSPDATHNYKVMMIVELVKEFFDPTFTRSDIDENDMFTNVLDQGYRLNAVAMVLRRFNNEEWYDYYSSTRIHLVNLLMILESSYTHKLSNPSNPSQTMEMSDTILLTDGTFKGTSVPRADAVALSRTLYSGASDDEPAYCHISDAFVSLSTYSAFPNSTVMEDDAVNTEDGYVDVSERCVVDYTQHLELPVLYTRRYHYNLEEDYNCNGRWICVDSDDVVEAIYNEAEDTAYMLNDNVVYCETNDCYYRNESVANDCGVYYSERHDAYVQRVEYRANYGQLSDTDKRNSETIVSFGVEVEKEDAYVMETIRYNELYDTTGWAKERDGSLDSDMGFELVSPIYDLFDLTALKKDLENRYIREHVNASYNSDTCGGHITISVRDMSSFELIGGLKAFFPLLYSLYPDRCSESYSQAKSAYDLILSPTKYSAVYVKNDKLVEFRIFPAVVNTTDLLWRIELMQFIVRNYGASEKQVHKMIVQKGSRLNTLLKTYARRSGMQVSKAILSWSLDYVNNVKTFNKVAVSDRFVNL